jgi:NAD+ kinase
VLFSLEKPLGFGRIQINAYPSMDLTCHTIGITSKPRKIEIKEIVHPLIDWLANRGLEVLIDHETRDNLEVDLLCFTRSEIAQRAGLIIVLGGDGTLLATARSLDRKAVPLLPVNLGGLGFLTVITLEEVYSTLESVFAGDFKTERRTRIEATVLRKAEEIPPFLALNDVVFNKGAIARLSDFEVWVDRKFVTTYKSDGLIVSTPTGSTAYSLAAGGPVIVPSVSALVVTPICAHTLTHRPIVLPDSAVVEVAMKNHHESVYLTVDGQEAMALRDDDRVALTKSASFVELVQSPHKNYFEILRQKLRWGER